MLDFHGSQPGRGGDDQYSKAASSRLTGAHSQERRSHQSRRFNACLFSISPVAHQMLVALNHVRFRAFGTGILLQTLRNCLLTRGSLYATSLQANYITSDSHVRIFPFLSHHTPLQRRVYFLVLVPPSTGSPPGYPVIMQFKPALALVYLKRVSPHGKRARPPNRLSTHGVPSTPDLLWTSCRPCVLQVYVYIIEEESWEELVLFVLSKLPFIH